MDAIGNSDINRFTVTTSAMMTAQESTAQLLDIDLDGEQSGVLNDSELRAQLFSLVCPSHFILID